MIIKINSLVIESFISGLHMGKMAILLHVAECVSKCGSERPARCLPRADYHFFSFKHSEFPLGKYRCWWTIFPEDIINQVSQCFSVDSEFLECDFFSKNDLE